MNTGTRVFLLIGCGIYFTASAAFAQTNFSRINGFEPRFLPPVHTSYKNIKTDFGAKGDGVTDDTKAFADCIMSGARTIYIPAGTYLLKDQVRVRDGMKRTLFIGECRTTTVLKLADNSPGFNNPASPKAFLHTRAPLQFGEQNMHMYVYHLTLEIGRGNPGAVGLNHHTNNTGQIKDVCVRATDPVNHKGLRGIAFDDWWYGPGGGRYLEVEGFKTGVYVGSAQNHTTLEHVTIRACDIGLEIQWYPDTVMAVSCRGLVTTGCATAVVNGGLLALVESDLGGSGQSAIANKGALLCRAVKTAGFTRAISSATPAGDLAGPSVDHYSSHTPAYLWQPGAGMDRTLGLEVRESPEHPYPATAAGWTLITGTTDVGPAINQAIAGGATDILVAGGRLTTTVALKGSVRRVMGLGVRPIVMTANPVFRCEDGQPAAAIVELLYQDYGSTSTAVVEHASKRSVVFRHGSGGFRNTAAAAGGRAFIESVVGYPFVFTGVNAWVRDINTEAGGPNRPNIVNDNSVLWILGQKTEDYATKISTTNGGLTELLGGTFRQNHDWGKQIAAGIDTANPPPLFIIDNAHASLCYRDSDCYLHNVGHIHKWSVGETRGSETRKFARSASLCGAMALYVGYTKAPAVSVTIHPMRGQGLGQTSSRRDLLSGHAPVFDLHGRRITPRCSPGRMPELIVSDGRLHPITRNTPVH